VQYLQEYEASTTTKASPIVVTATSLRKSTRQKVAPDVYKPELMEVPITNKRKAVESPSKPAKLLKQEEDLEPVEIDISDYLNTSRCPILFSLDQTN
jgi:hypothetical protein